MTVRKPSNLWQFNRVTGYWEYVRSCTTNATCEEWLRIYKSDSPGEIFKVSVKKPSENPLMKNPAPKRKTAALTQRAAIGYVNRPSQITKKTPSKRLKERRRINLQVPRGVFPNPGRSGVVDYEAARELFTYGVNDGELYERRTIPIINNLAKKIAKGTFDYEKSLTLWKYWADDAAKRYAEEFGGKFSVATRKEAAKMAAEYYDDEIRDEVETLAKPKRNPVLPGIMKVGPSPFRKVVGPTYKVERSMKPDKDALWIPCAIFDETERAVKFAQALAKSYPSWYIRVIEE